jgi:3',5'-cyclic AMP phosphodiesterase CpdA
MKHLLPIFFLIFTAFQGFTQTLIRGPYLMVGTPTSIVVRWRTDQPTTSRVKFGSSENSLTKTVDDNTLVTEHIVKLSGLSPKTKYYYSIGSSAAVYQGDGNNYFETMPVAGEAGKYRFGLFGDCGVNSAIQGNTRDQLNNYVGNNYLNAWLLLGDNAYGFGMDTEYQSNFFNHYRDTFMKKSPLYPTPGNHDYNNDNADRQNDHDISYYKVFSMPTNAEAGGLASGTQSYYSYDYGNVHFLSLDSFGKEDRATRLYDTLGKQVQWIKADLAANKNKDWIVAYWHHPPYSQGSRNSETDPEMTAIRQNFIRILERNGVDLIVCGHSHLYERSRLMGGHYDKAATFDPGVNNYSSSSGKYDGSDNSCPYLKDPAKKNGTVYVVSGSAGQLGARSPGFPHKAMYYSDNDHAGAMLLEVEKNRLDAKWIGTDGVIRDRFTIEKNVNKTTEVNIDYGASTTLTPSFIDTYKWSTGATSKSITVSPAASAEYQVTDGLNCVTDVFKVNVTPPLPVKLISFEGSASAENLISLKWSTAYETNSQHFVIERSLDGNSFQQVATVDAANTSGQETKYTWNDETSVNIVNHDSAYYRLKMVDNGGKFTFSRILAIKINLITKTVDIEVVPNPALANAVQLRLAGKSTAEADLLLTDQSGRILLKKSVTLTDKLTSFLPANTAAGIYILKVVIDGTSYVKKIVAF